VAFQPKADPGRLVLKFLNKPQLGTHVHPAGFFWTSDQVVAEAVTYTTHNWHKRRTSMPSAGFEPAIPAIKQLRTYTLDCTATGIGIIRLYYFEIPSSSKFCYKLRHTKSGPISRSHLSARFRNWKCTVSDTRTKHNRNFATPVFLVGEGWHYGLLSYDPV
jgi:hypothetical protein